MDKLALTSYLKTNKSVVTIKTFSRTINTIEYNLILTFSFRSNLLKAIKCSKCNNNNSCSFNNKWAWWWNINNRCLILKPLQWYNKCSLWLWWCRIWCEETLLNLSLNLKCISISCSKLLSKNKRSLILRIICSLTYLRLLKHYLLSMVPKRSIKITHTIFLIMPITINMLLLENNYIIHSNCSKHKTRINSILLWGGDYACILSKIVLILSDLVHSYFKL